MINFTLSYTSCASWRTLWCLYPCSSTSTISSAAVGSLSSTSSLNCLSPLIPHFHSHVFSTIISSHRADRVYKREPFCDPQATLLLPLSSSGGLIPPKKTWWVSSFFSLAAGGQAILRQRRIFVVESILIIELKIIWTRSLFFYFSIPWNLMIKNFIGLAGEKPSNNRFPLCQLDC